MGVRGRIRQLTEFAENQPKNPQDHSPMVVLSWQDGSWEVEVDGLPHIYADEHLERALDKAVDAVYSVEAVQEAEVGTAMMNRG